MKLPDSEHEHRPWRIHELASDFTLEDVWALPIRGGLEDFQGLLDLTFAFDPSKAESRPTRFLWNLRDRLGAWFGLGEISTPVDSEAVHRRPIPDGCESSVRDRLPPDLRGTTSEVTFGALPFVPLYRLDREAAAEVSNRTVHGIAHLSWVRLAQGRYEGRLAVYVKPRGILGRAYMGLIKPFRYWIVYPALMRQMERTWNERHADGRPHDASANGSS
jgi:hypothetical protein